MLRLLLCHSKGDFCPGQDSISEEYYHVKSFFIDFYTNFVPSLISYFSLDLYPHGTSLRGVVYQHQTKGEDQMKTQIQGKGAARFSRAVAFLLASAVVLPSQVVGQQEQVVTFSQTGKMVRGTFLSTWQQHGGLAQFGFPISEEMQERSNTDNKLYTVQYFERAVFELHAENRPPYNVLLSLLGTSEYKARYGSSGAQAQRASAVSSLLFRETGKRVGGAFRDYWERNGGLFRFGYPLSEEFQERSISDGRTYLVQYFERALFQYHPENADPHKILLGLLGRSQFEARHSTAKPSSLGTLQPVSAMVSARACQSATLLPNGSVLVAGGIDNNETPLSSAELYDPTSGAFTAIGSMAVGRACHSATLLPSGKVLIAGGAGRTALSSAELYDPATRKFTPTHEMTVAHQGHRATLLANGKVLITGGGDGANGDIAELYNPEMGTFSVTGKTTVPRVAHTATLLRNGKVLLTGGSSSRTNVLQSAELYDPATGVFTTTGEMGQIRHKHAAELLPNGKVLVLGGSDSRDWRGRYSTAEIYDPATGSFSRTGSMSQPRFKLMDAVISLKNGNVIAVGGGTQVELFDHTAGAFQSTKGDMDAERFYMTATSLLDGRVLVLGGYDMGINVSSKAWIYQP